MGTLVVCLAGMIAGRMMRRFMKQRLYSRFDDLLMGVLGALLGESLAIMGGVTVFGGQLFAGGVGAVLLLSLTGLWIEPAQGRRGRLQGYRRAPAAQPTAKKASVSRLRIAWPTRGKRVHIPGKIAA